MHTFGIIGMPFKKAKALFASSVKPNLPSAVLTRWFGPLDIQKRSSLRTWIFGGACAIVTVVGVSAFQHSVPISHHLVSAAVVLHFITELHYFDPVREDAKILFIAISAGNAFLLAGTSVFANRDKLKEAYRGVKAFESLKAFLIRHHPLLIPIGQTLSRVRSGWKRLRAGFARRPEQQGA